MGKSRTRKQYILIYYSHFNEDSSIEKELLAGAKANLLICVAGSGERVISLLNCPTVQKVDIVDVNVEALYLTELKICALKHLDVEAYLSFIGFSIAKKSRCEMLNTFSDQLSKDCLKFWQQRANSVENGICYSGHFEKYLKRIRPIVKIILGKQFYQCFNNNKDQWTEFPTRRWNILKWIFSQRFIYILTGMSDQAFVSEQSRLNVIPKALQKALDEDRVESSAFFHLIFKGHLNDMPAELLPYSFSPSFLFKIKERLDTNSFI